MEPQTNFPNSEDSENIPDALECLAAVREGQEKVREQRASDVKRKRKEVEQNQELRANMGVGLRSKRMLKEQLQYLSNTNEVSLLKLKEDIDIQKDESNELEEQKQKLMENLMSRSQKCIQRFSSAPENYNIKSISKVIESLDKMFNDLEINVCNMLDPEINTLITELDQEPLILLEMQGFASTELTSKDLRTMNDKLKENFQNFHLGIKDGLKEIELLRKEESDLN